MNRRFEMARHAYTTVPFYRELAEKARTTAFNLVHLMQKYRFRPDKREDGLIKQMLSELEENDRKLMQILAYEWKTDEKENENG